MMKEFVRQHALRLVVQIRSKHLKPTSRGHTSAHIYGSVVLRKRNSVAKVHTRMINFHSKATAQSTRLLKLQFSSIQFCIIALGAIPQTWMTSVTTTPKTAATTTTSTTSTTTTTTTAERKAAFNESFQKNQKNWLSF